LNGGKDVEYLAFFFFGHKNPICNSYIEGATTPLSRPQVPCRPTLGSKYAAMRKRLELGARSRLPALEGGKRGVLEVPGKTRKSGQALLTHTGLHETTQSG